MLPSTPLAGADLVTEHNGDVTTPNPQPMRLSDGDRNAAVSRLRDNLDAGRLTTAEFDQRTAAVLDARTQAQLDPLFSDLPPVSAPGAYEVYPHQSVAPYSGDPEPGGPGELPGPYATGQSGTRTGNGFSNWATSVPKWVWWIVLASAIGSIIAAVASRGGGFFFPWWLIFFLFWGGRWRRRR